MAETDPREYRGGVREPQQGGGGDEGIVPREMVDEPTAATSSDNNELGDAVQGQVTDRDPHDSAIDESGGDAADATSHSGTGANAAEVKQEMQEGEPVPWPQAANVAREDQDPDTNAQA